MKKNKKVLAFILSMAVFLQLPSITWAAETGDTAAAQEEQTQAAEDVQEITEEEAEQGENGQEEDESGMDETEDDRDYEEDAELLEYIKTAQEELAGLAKKETLMALVYLCDSYEVKDTPDSEGGTVASIPSGAMVLIKGMEVDEDFNLWFQVSFEKGGTSYKGYVERGYLAYSNEQFIEWENNYFPQAAMFAAVSGYLDVEQFPASYQDKLIRLKQAHPNWIFVRQNTNLSWSKVVSEECYKDRSLVHSSKGEAYRREQHSPGWYYASEQAVKYYLDPRNFLDEARIFQFEQLTYNPSYHSKAAVQNILKSTFMKGEAPGAGMTYAEAFFQIGVSLKVSPFHLACRVYQEQGEGKSALISGNYTTVPEYKGYYNYYNIGASGTTTKQVVESGLARAVKEGWNSHYASLKGGAGIIAKNYILRGQDTLYLQKFDVDSSDGTLYTHQYMQNITAPYTESSMVRKAYMETNSLDNPFVFKIPVYNDMPSAACPVPGQSTPTATPTAKPTETPTASPTVTPTVKPAATPTAKPTETPTAKPTAVPTATPTISPTAASTVKPVETPDSSSVSTPTVKPTATPTVRPTATVEPTARPTTVPTAKPVFTEKPRATATPMAGESPELRVSASPTSNLTATVSPTPASATPGQTPEAGSTLPSAAPGTTPSANPTSAPASTEAPAKNPDSVQTAKPVSAPPQNGDDNNSPDNDDQSSNGQSDNQNDSGQSGDGQQQLPTAETALTTASPASSGENIPVPASVTENTSSSGVIVAASTPKPHTLSEDGETVTMDMSRTGMLYAQTLKQISEQGTEVVLKVNDKVRWSIDGSQIDTEEFDDIDLKVTLGSSRIPKDRLAILTENEQYVEMSLAHDGEFGFTMRLSVILEDAEPGQFANLFYYSEETDNFEFMCASEISSSKEAVFEFRHASDYVIIISDYTKENLLAEKAEEFAQEKQQEMEAMAQAKEETPAKEPVKAAGFIALILLASAAIGIGVYLIVKRKDE